MLSLGKLCTDDNNDANNDDNDTRQTNHDCIGSLVCMPNEPKTAFTPSKLFGHMDQKYSKIVYLRRNIWVYKRIFVRNSHK